MILSPHSIPLSLYIHIPWCIQKCPYCDFNSHAVKEGIPEENYVSSLLQDLDDNLNKLEAPIARPLTSIFFGGGTPSLFSPQAIERILEGVKQRFRLASELEITLEANPGTIEQKRFQAYRSLGINRLSLGIQSLQDSKLKALGRIHDRETAIRAVKAAQDSGFENFNLDLMYGLPEQTKAEALQDLEEALQLQPAHLSWYQLTLEPNTAFYLNPPPLPEDEAIWEMQVEGQALLLQTGFQQYEVSAYHKKQACKHNLNYWQFGDYLGIGAGAHSKISNFQEQKIYRHWQLKNPRAYLASKNKTADTRFLSPADLRLEFMLNALRLTEGVSFQLFEERTGLDARLLELTLQEARRKKLLEEDNLLLKPSALGKRFLNDLIA
ncbi:MAG TPA: radical SAM family heme chaperone HemW, partial [Gammaproteobacteria bacterium]|nr:radical SAM family heme chaperone HemW [Gammaproteobacteria bacterium]